MSSIQDFVQLATQSLGISEQTSRAATGGLLGLIKNIASGPFKVLAAKIPGVEELAVETPRAAQAGQGVGSVLGGLMTAAG